MPSHNSHLTAISRKTLPKPTRWLMDKGLIWGRTLDYGCGKCFPINPIDWDNYDPYYYPVILSPGYQTIICNYVLCTLPTQAERMKVLRQINFLLYSNGIAYISVRNDKPRWGWGVSKRGTYQGRVQGLPLPLLYKCHGFRIYRLTPDTNLG
jgi:ATP adenylyltransferase